MAEKSANNLIIGIENSKDISFERVLYGLGIRYVGETVAKKLARHFENVDMLIKSNFDKLISVDEIGDKIANSILDFFNNEENIGILNKLKSYGLKFEIDEKDKNISSIFSGKSFVISGVFSNYSRSDIKNLIESNGGRVSSSISSKTNYLVAGQNMGPIYSEPISLIAFKVGIIILLLIFSSSFVLSNLDGE